MKKLEGKTIIVFGMRMFKQVQRSTNEISQHPVTESLDGQEVDSVGCETFQLFQIY